jgi:hypothetical protein
MEKREKRPEKLIWTDQSWQRPARRRQQQKPGRERINLMTVIAQLSLQRKLE